MPGNAINSLKHPLIRNSFVPNAIHQLSSQPFVFSRIFKSFHGFFLMRTNDIPFSLVYFITGINLSSLLPTKDLYLATIKEDV